MLIELGNHSPKNSLDGRPAVTTIHIPEADEFGLGGYSHKIGGISCDDFRGHIGESLMRSRYDGGYPITRLPDHEILLAIDHAWPNHSDGPPAWLEVTPSYGELLPDGITYRGRTPDGVAEDISNFLHEHFNTEGRIKPLDVEEKYWTRAGAPGQFPMPPSLMALFTNDGRTLQAQSFGGGQTGLSGTGSAATGTSFTTDKTLVTNAWAGYRIYAYNGTSIVWGNIESNNNTGSASVVNIDRWYNAATPGGAAATTPASGYYFILADGGSISSWFVGLTTTAGGLAVTNHSLAGEYTTASGGMIRKIAPWALTSGTSPMSYTLTPVYTVNASDSGLPLTFQSIGVFCSMVVADTTLAMPFQTALSASATVGAIGDQLTVTETVSGS